MASTKPNRKIFLLLLLITDIIIGILFSIHIELPGVYFDSAITDYIASTIVHPGIDNQTGTMMSHVGIPLLGGIYHGTTSMFLQSLILLVFHGSVWTLRFAYIIYVLVCIDLVMVLLLRITGSEWYSLAGALLFGTNAAVMTTIRTQYDIMLPGVIFFLICGLMINHIITAQNRTYLFYAKYLFIAGFCLGIAFYDYFCFFFMIPVLVVLGWNYNSEHKKYGISAAVWGFLLGCSFYFCGYADSLLTNLSGHTFLTKIVYTSFCVVFYIILLIPSFYLLKEKKISYTVRKLYLVFSGIVIIAGIIAIALCWPLVYSKIHAIEWGGVTGRAKGSSIAERMVRFFVLFYSLGSGSAAELQINGSVTSVATGIYLFVFGFSTVMFLLLSLMRKHRTEAVITNYYFLAFFLSFYICSLPIIMEMQPQHFVPLFFISFAVFILNIYCIEEMYKEHRDMELTKCLEMNRKYAVRRLIALVTLIGLVIINIFDLSHFYKKLDNTRGVGAYSEELNILFDSAYRDSLNRKTVYFMINPGMVPSFIYMTDNHIKVELLYGVDGRTDITKTLDMRKYLEQGYTVYLLSCNEDFSELLSIIGEKYGFTIRNRKAVNDTLGNLVYSICEVDR